MKGLLLKDMYMNPDLRETLTIWDMQLVSYGSKIIERRKLFVKQLNEMKKMMKMFNNKNFKMPF